MITDNYAKKLTEIQSPTSCEVALDPPGVEPLTATAETDRSIEPEGEVQASAEAAVDASDAKPLTAAAKPAGSNLAAAQSEGNSGSAIDIFGSGNLITGEDAEQYQRMLAH